MKPYDAIVIGTGGVGSAALFHLAQQGLNVLGIDRFPGGHDRGSSHGQTRIIRLAYFEHPDYVPLLRRAYELWETLQSEVNEQLYFETGLLEIGPPNGLVIPGVRASAQEHQLFIESLCENDLRDRYPGFRLPEGYQALFERRAGYLRVEACVLAHLQRARDCGAELHIGESVQSYRCEQGEVIVETERNRFRGKRLVITAGAWAADLLAPLQQKLVVLKKHLYWIAPQTTDYLASRGAPCFFYETPTGCYYGFPQLDAMGVKVAAHSGGEVVHDPLKATRDRDPLDERSVRDFLSTCMPQVCGDTQQHAVCFYTLSPDEHFIIDRVPNQEEVVFAAGLSGHGFKFASVLGEMLADYVRRGSPSLPCDFLSLKRFGTNPR